MRSNCGLHQSSLSFQFGPDCFGCAFSIHPPGNLFTGLPECSRAASLGMSLPVRFRIHGVSAINMLFASLSRLFVQNQSCLYRKRGSHRYPESQARGTVELGTLSCIIFFSAAPRGLSSLDVPTHICCEIESGYLGCDWNPGCL